MPVCDKFVLQKKKWCVESKSIEKYQFQHSLSPSNLLNFFISVSISPLTNYLKQKLQSLLCIPPHSILDSECLLDYSLTFASTIAILSHVICMCISVTALQWAPVTTCFLSTPGHLSHP